MGNRRVLQAAEGVPQVAGGLPGSQALADLLECCDASSKLGHLSMEDKPCPLSVQTHRFMRDRNLPQKNTWAVENQVLPIPPVTLTWQKGSTLFSSSETPLVMPSTLQNHGLSCYYGGLSPNSSVSW